MLFLFSFKPNGIHLILFVFFMFFGIKKRPILVLSSSCSVVNMWRSSEKQDVLVRLSVLKCGLNVLSIITTFCVRVCVCVCMCVCVCFVFLMLIKVNNVQT